MKQILESLDKGEGDPDALMGVHSANNWTECEELKNDLKVL